MSPGTIVPKGQQAFSGEWKDAVSPDEMMANKQAVEAARAKHAQDQAAAAEAAAAKAAAPSKAKPGARSK